MGDWGTGFFENDDALDWLGRLAEQGHDLIAAAISKVDGTPPESTLEAPDAAEALAAVSIIAGLKDTGVFRNLPDAARDWLKQAQFKPEPGLVESANRALLRVIGPNSELNELWEESAEYLHWREGVDDLGRILSRTRQKSDAANIVSGQSLDRTPPAFQHQIKPVFQSDFRPGWSGARLAMIMYGMKFLCALAFGLLGSAADRHRLFNDGVDITTSDELILALGAGLAALVWLAMVVLATASFMYWIFRASTNLPKLMAGGAEYSPGWCVGWWFIPIMCIYHPYRIIRELWQGSSPLINRDNIAAWQLFPLPGWLLIWWIALLLISKIPGTLARVGEDFPMGTPEMSTGILIAGLSSAVASLLYLSIVYLIDRRQNERFRALKTILN